MGDLESREAALIMATLVDSKSIKDPYLQDDDLLPCRSRF